MGELGLDYRLQAAEEHGQVEELARAAAGSGAKFVVAVGGDGTVNEAINGMMRARAEAGGADQCVLGIIPAGSGNGFARSLGIPRSASEVCRLLVNGAARRVDLGRMTATGERQPATGTDGFRDTGCGMGVATGGRVRDRYFAGTIGFGFDALIARETCRRRGRFRSLAIYAWGGLKSYLGLASVLVKGEIDGRPFERSCLLLDFANGPEYGGGARIAPKASLDDGLLDVVVVDQAAIWRLLGHLPALFTGRLADRPGTETFQARAAAIESVQPPLAQMDGDPIELELPARIEVVPRALSVLC